MNFNIDIAIFVGFLALNLVLGLMASRGVNTIRSFAVGDKNFTTATLAFTIISIWVSGEFFFTIVAESYKDGLLFISILVANFLAYLSVGLLFAPRLGEFLDKISIAEAMGSLYGKKVRSVTAISGVVGIIGIVAIQLQIAGVLFEYIIGTEKFYGVIISGIIITLYSSFGGIKSVTFTDIIQFCTFGIIIPVIAYFLLKNTCDPRLVFSTISQNPKFNFSSSFSFSNPEIYYYISLFLWLLIPHFNPAIFQRIAMAKNVKQVRDSFIIASFAGLILAALTCWIGILVLFNNPDIPEGDILRYTIVNYSWISGFNGMIAAGVMAMIMSTVDSHINSNSILLVHDLSHSLNVNLDKKELPYTRVCSLMIGVASILMALRGGNFFELIIWTSTFYMPVVTVPFIVSVFGFRSSGSSVLAGMGSGFAVVVIWEIFLKEHMAGVGGLIPGMFANLIVLFAYHHLFNQKGGWVEIKHVNELTISKKQTMKEKLANIRTSITSFDLLLSFKKNMPNNVRLTALFGVFLIISTFFSINTIPKVVHQNFSFLLDILYLTTASAATLLMGYPLYAQKCSKRDIAAILWNAIIFFVLICFSFLIVLMSNFSEVQLMVFMVNVMMISSLISWRYSLFYSLFGVAITVFVYEKFLIKYQTIGEISSLEFKIAYLALLIASVFVTFIKPSQEEREMAKEKVEILEAEKKSLGKELLNLKDENGKYKKEIKTLNQAVTHYSERVTDQAKEIERLGATAQKILNNVNHELRLPVGNVMNFSQMKCEGLDK
ncbi:MAG TPA: hypothetical protein QKA08_04025 [Candidatus Megaira endosymbiont of Nemacystus decipiens]|nr:hypothetical protein [Candidatus Megaera endosymbiont of Nemacystus decipiens]